MDQGMDELKGKVALVTGAAAGIGRAYCEELLKHGVKVSLCDQNGEEGEELADQLCVKYGRGKALFCQCDVTDYVQLEEAFQATISVFGGLDIVINNAGIFNDRFWELEVDVNLNGVIRGMLLALRFMGKDRGGRGGTVVNTASTLGFLPCACVPIYTATKHAIVGFSRSYGDPFHMSLSGVRVMALCPGATDTGNNAEDIRKGLLFPVYESVYVRDYDKRPHQSVQSVARGLIHILKEGASGSVWVVENSKPPKEVKLPANLPAPV